MKLQQLKSVLFVLGVIFFMAIGTYWVSDMFPNVPWILIMMTTIILLWSVW